MKMNCFIVASVLLCFFPTGLADVVDFASPCNAFISRAEIHQINVTGCIKNPCHFARGTNILVNIIFTANVPFTRCTVKAYGIIHRLTVPYSLEESDCCKMGCPVVSGERKEYSTSISISKHFPEMSLNVKFELMFDSGDGLCFLVPVTIV